jgi:hypothetical protein
MENIKKVQDLVSQKEEIVKQIEEIQKECEHEDKHIKFIFEYKGSTSKAMWTCKKCEKILNIPTQNELDNWLK